MTTIHWRRRALTLGVLAVGLPAAAFLPMAVALADQYDFTPNIGTFDPSQVEGYPPLINEVTGAENWNLFDLTTNSVDDPNILSGTDTVTTIGSFTNDDFLYQVPFAGLTILGPGAGDFFVPNGTQIDLANFGGGFENVWIDIPANGTDPGVSDLLITPFGDFSLFGSAFTDLAAVVG